MLSIDPQRIHEAVADDEVSNGALKMALGMIRSRYGIPREEVDDEQLVLDIKEMVAAIRAGVLPSPW